MGLISELENLLDSVFGGGGSNWGPWPEIFFWIGILLLHGGLIAYAAWRLAVQHTDATGSSIMVPVKPSKKDTDKSSGTSSSSSLLPSTVSRRRPGSTSAF